jgi:hypothetical protein
LEENKKINETKNVIKWGCSSANKYTVKSYELVIPGSSRAHHHRRTLPWITTAASAGQSGISRSNFESGTQGGRSSQGYVSDGLLLYKGHEIESGPDAIAGLRELGRKEKKKKKKEKGVEAKKKSNETYCRGSNQKRARENKKVLHGQRERQSVRDSKQSATTWSSRNCISSSEFRGGKEQLAS